MKNASGYRYEGVVFFVFLLLGIFQCFAWFFDLYIFQLCSFLCSYILLFVFSVLGFRFLSPAPLFLLASFFYFSAGAVDLHFFNNEDSLDPKRIGLLILMGYFFVLFFVFMLRFFCVKSFVVLNFSGLDRLSCSQFFVSKGRLFSGLFLIFFTPVYIYVFGSSYGFGVGDVSRGDIYKEQNFLLVALRIFLPVVAIAYVWFYFLSQKRSLNIFNFAVLFSLACVLLFDLVFKGDRRVVVSVVLALLSLKYHGKNIPLKIFAVGAFFVVALYFYGAVRNRPFFMWADNITEYMAAGFSPSKTEFGPFSVIANEILSGENFFSSLTLFNGLLSALPSFVYPDRPLASSVWFVKEYFPDFYDVGGGLAFNIVVDAALMFGFLAPVFLAVAYALVFSIANQRGESRSLVCALLIYIFTFTARFDFTSIYQVVGYSLFVLLSGYFSLLLLVGQRRPKRIL